MLLLPFVGTLIYLIVRPAGATASERRALDAASWEFVARYSPDNRAEQLRVLAELPDRGALSEEEFRSEKARLLGAEASVPHARAGSVA